MSFKKSPISLFIFACVFACVGIFWSAFWLLYPYRRLIDDSRYELILKEQVYPYSDWFTRMIHHGLLFFEGIVFRWDIEQAVTFSVGIHLLTVGLLTFYWIPKSSNRVVLALRGLAVLSLAIHPSSLQTVVHLAQRSELLGMFFLALYLIESDHQKTRIAVLFFLAMGALFSKEPYGLIAFMHLSAVLLSHVEFRRFRLLVFMFALILAAGAAFNSFSTSIVHNESNYEKSRAFRKSVENNQVISDESSTILPIRDRQENLFLQTALIPRILHHVFLPFSTVQDEGHFPFGRHTYQSPWWKNRAFLLGLLALGMILSFVIWMISRRALPWPIKILALSPFIHYGVYWIFPVYDPLMLYRLYALGFLFFGLTLPTCWQVLLNSQIHTSFVFFRRFTPVLGASIAVITLSSGVLKFYEMIDPLRQAEAELARSPHHYRNYVFVLRAHLQQKRFPIDCRALLEPALTLTPSTAMIYIEWAFCHTEQGQGEEAKNFARLALKQAQVPENVRVASHYLMGPNGFEVPVSEIHPANLKVLLQTP